MAEDARKPGAVDAFAQSDREGWAAHLHAKGYVVVRGVLTPAQCGEAMAQLWAVMEALSPVRRAAPASWARSDQWPPMLHGGMIQYVGHTELQWRLRELAAPTFAAYYGCAPEALATSFDGLCLMHGARGYRKHDDLVSFLHCDQSPRRAGEWSVQGVLNLADAGPRDGGLVVVPGTHREHQEFFAARPWHDGASDWYKLTDEEKASYRERAVKVCAGPGDLLLWDSRTLHCNVPPARRDAVRACTYVCMLPASRVSPEVRVKRHAAWHARRTSSHHPGEGFRVFPTLPRFGVRGRDEFLTRVVALQNGFALTPLQRALRCGGDAE